MRARLRQLLDQPPSPRVALAVSVLLCLIWGSTWSVIRVGLDGMAPFTGVALRFLIASLLLVVLARLLRISLRGDPIERRLWLVHAICAFCISYGVTYWSEQWISSGLASLLFATFPLMVAPLAHAALPGERLRPAGWLGLVVGFGGVAVIFSQDLSGLGGGERALVAAAAMLLAPFGSAIGAVTVKRWGEHVSPISLNAMAMGLAAGAMGAVAWGLERERTILWDLPTAGSLLYLAVIGSAVTFTLYYWLLRHLPATRLALIAYVIPVVAVAIGAVFLGEPVTARSVGGGALVLGGVALATRS